MKKIVPVSFTFIILCSILIPLIATMLSLVLFTNYILSDYWRITEIDWSLLEDGKIQLLFVIMFVSSFIGISGVYLSLWLGEKASSALSSSNEEEERELSCSKCGAELKQSDNFCIICGKKVR